MLPVLPNFGTYFLRGVACCPWFSKASYNSPSSTAHIHCGAISALPYNTCGGIPPNSRQFNGKLEKKWVKPQFFYSLYEVFLSAAQPIMQCSCNVSSLLHCCYAAGAVLIGLAYAGSSILQHGSSSPTPPAMLLGCCYVTCTDAQGQERTDQISCVLECSNQVMPSLQSSIGHRI